MFQILPPSHESGLRDNEGKPYNSWNFCWEIASHSEDPGSSEIVSLILFAEEKKKDDAKRLSTTWASHHGHGETRLSEYINQLTLVLGAKH